MNNEFLSDIFYYFLATVSLVPLFKRFGLGPIAGYLCAGLILGPNCLSLLKNSGQVETISEIGVILLMFVIGLEMSLSRLAHLKGFILRYGAVQFFASTLVLTYATHFFTKSWTSSILIAMALSLSSTAFCLHYLRDSGKLTKSYGQISFSTLLFQDMIVIPIVALIPFFNYQTRMDFSFDVVLKGISFFALILFGKYLLPKMVSVIHRHGSREIFISLNLLIITGCALSADSLGLSKALGAFLAGLFLSESALKQEIQNFTIPLKSMLMGVFFMAFGLKLDLSIFNDQALTIIGGTIGFMAIKYLLVHLMVRTQYKTKTALNSALILCSGGEFGLLLLDTSLNNLLLSPELYQITSSSIILSIFLAPVLTKVLDIFDVPEEEAEIHQLHADKEISLKKVA